MRLSEFKLLNEHEKIDTVYRQGVYVGKASKEGMIAVLYQVGIFYVEIKYIKYRYKIFEINSFASTQELDPYIEQISIQPLVYW